MDVDIASRVIELDSLVLFTILQHLSATTDLKSVACVNSGCRAAAAVRGSPKRCDPLPILEPDGP